MKTYNIILSGVGGQGTVLASKLLAAAAMKKEIPVMSAETIGMAQKGGSVFSHVRMGDRLHAPMLAKGTADLLIAFEPAEAVRMLPYLKEGGAAVVNSCPVIPVHAMLSKSGYSGDEMTAYLKENLPRLTLIDGEKACRDLGSSKVLNTVLLGAAIRMGELPISESDIEALLAERIKPQFLDLNIRALHYIGAD